VRSAFDLGRVRLLFYRIIHTRVDHGTKFGHFATGDTWKLNAQAQESNRAADIARLRYREGVIDFLSLLDAERTQLQAEDAVAESEQEVYVAVIALYKALGGVPS
jgi:hypothetical protein